MVYSREIGQSLAANWNKERHACRSTPSQILHMSVTCLSHVCHISPTQPDTFLELARRYIILSHESMAAHALDASGGSGVAVSSVLLNSRHLANLDARALLQCLLGGPFALYQCTGMLPHVRLRRTRDAFFSGTVCVLVLICTPYSLSIHAHAPCIHILYTFYTQFVPSMATPNTHTQSHRVQHQQQTMQRSACMLGMRWHMPSHCLGLRHSKQTAHTTHHHYSSSCIWC